MGSSGSKQMQSYKDACRDDPNIRSFDATLQTRTTEVLRSVVADIDIRSLSFDSLKEVYGGLFAMNQGVVSIILSHQKDVWNNPQLSELVEEYFNNSLQMLDLCRTLEKCLNRARDRQLIISVALQRFEEEDGDEANNEEKYSKTLEELNRFRNAEYPFTEEFFQILGLVYEQQRSMLKKLELHKRKINKKIKSVKTYRKLTGIIFVATVVAVVICSIVAAAVAAPPIAAVLAAVASVPLGSMGKWVDSHWKRYQVELEKHEELLSSMHLRTLITISDLDSIQALVDKLEERIKSLMGIADFALRGEEMVKLGIGEIKKNMEMFMQSLEDLGAQARNCSEHVTKGRTAILQKIIKSKK
ncbi:UPF0496 protein 1-like protein [Cinnamomum micranthum f. kanehirae]|uniref:UPF0496 protein 1-like protein n=1 Tax=Cinnamomum micranthum f. kanehirae TaxID=337451 RepID=A0A443N6V0_9MAGN|nr:UPF0496 protein 1-like protein [Cinnamomum micranthum f. kanehirae]